MKIKNTLVESTPCLELDVTVKGKTVAWLHLYWSVNAGMYGYQVAARFNTKEDGSGYAEYKTGGCGYCKEADAFEHFLLELTDKYVGLGGSCSYYLRGTKYHKGGNYYSVPLSVLKRLIKNRGIR